MNWTSKWSKEQIKSILFDQLDTFWQQDIGIERTKLAEIERMMDTPHAVIISGLRRVGKSTLLSQIAHKLGKDQFFYINFEDDRFLGFQAEDATYLYELLIELFGEQKIFIIDEIQNISGWEHFIRRFMDMGIKFFITGSNASLLSRELGTRLTGRYIPIELFPFSFREYLIFKGDQIPDLKRMTTTQRAKVNHSLNNYLQQGGIPDALKYPEISFLRTLYDDVLYRDIATRHRIEAVTALKELSFFLLSNPAAAINFNRLKQQFGLGSINTIKSYIEYLKNSWLLFTTNIYDYSVKRQQISPKKVYCIDTGFVNQVGFGNSPNTGHLLENLVFLALRRKTKDIHYLSTPNGYEIDFFLPEEGVLIQVTQQMQNEDTRKREIRAIEDTLAGDKFQKAIILTHDNEDTMILKGKPVEIRAISDWLLTQN